MALRGVHTYPDCGEPLMVQFIAAWGKRSQRSCHLKKLCALRSSSDCFQNAEAPTPHPLKEAAASCPVGLSFSDRDLILPVP